LGYRINKEKRRKENKNVEKKKDSRNARLVEKKNATIAIPGQAGCALSIAVFKSSLFNDTHCPGKILNQDYGSDVCCALAYMYIYIHARETLKERERKRPREIHVRNTDGNKHISAVAEMT